MGFTANKAWAGALVVLVTYLLSRFGLGEAPPIETVQDAIGVVAEAGASAVAGYVMVWLVPNKKEPATGAKLKAAPLTVLAAILAALFLVGGCASLGVRSAVDGDAPAELKVYAAQQDFRVTLAVPAAYEALPRCSGAATAMTACSNPAIVMGLRKAVVLARDSLAQAEAAAVAGQPDAAIYIGTATSTLTSVYAILGNLVAASTQAPAAATGAGVAATAADWQRAAAALRDLDRPVTKADTGSAALAITAGMKGLSALLVALPVGSATYVDAKQTKALVEEMAKAGHVPTLEQRAQLNAAIGLLVDQILAE
jgi:hypothetical protein